MKQIKPFETWIIRHKETRQIWSAPSGKTSWKATGHAKNAWASMISGYNTVYQQQRCEELGVEKVFDRQYKDVNYYRVPYFDEQSVYELVKLETSTLDRLTIAENLLKMCLGRVENLELENSIKEFLNV